MTLSRRRAVWLSSAAEFGGEFAGVRDESVVGAGKLFAVDLEPVGQGLCAMVGKLSGEALPAPTTTFIGARPQRVEIELVLAETARSPPEG